MDVPDKIAQLRRRFAQDVIGNRVRPSRDWNKDCGAYNVHIEPDDSARDQLTAAQAGLVAAKPTLLICPADTLHLSVAWLLAVHIDYGESKQEIWARHGAEWCAQLTGIAAQHGPFKLRFRWLVVTDTSVIAIATPTEPVQQLRAAITASLFLPPQTKNNADIVHITVARYQSPLANPAGLLAQAHATPLDAPSLADALVVSEELVFPSLVTNVRARLKLGGTASWETSA
jgi:hypothetical protein